MHADEFQTQGIALLCDNGGNILRIIRNELDLAAPLNPGYSLTRLVDRASLHKLLNFLLALRTDGAAFDWELNVPLAGQVATLHFAGTVSGDYLVIIGARSRQSVLQLYEDMMRISNEQINTFRLTTKEQLEQAQTQVWRDDTLYDEISRLNNELVGVQRELAKKNAQQERLNRQLHQLNQQKNIFLGIAAHDLRAPLANIKLTATLLLDAAGSLSAADLEQLLQLIVRQSEYMSVLLTDLLDVVQIERGEFKLQPEPVDVAAFLAAAVERHVAMAVPKGTMIGLEPVPAGDMLADPIRLRQVIDNLISNAVKYSPAGSTVRVLAGRVDDVWRLAVQDQGPGLTSQDRERLFQEFAKLSARPTGGESSTGLGLAISRRIVQAHSGQIGADSPPGEGATFWFTIPARIPAAS